MQREERARYLLNTQCKDCKFEAQQKEARELFDSYTWENYYRPLFNVVIKHCLINKLKTDKYDTVNRSIQHSNPSRRRNR
jgi:hypothetical protein